MDHEPSGSTRPDPAAGVMDLVTALKVEARDKVEFPGPRLLSGHLAQFVAIVGLATQLARQCQQPDRTGCTRHQLSKAGFGGV
jgi:hypothetical protein